MALLKIILEPQPRDDIHQVRHLGAVISQGLMAGCDIRNTHGFEAIARILENRDIGSICAFDPDENGSTLIQISFDLSRL